MNEKRLNWKMLNEPPPSESSFSVVDHTKVSWEMEIWEHLAVRTKVVVTSMSHEKASVLEHELAVEDYELWRLPIPGQTAHCRAYLVPRNSASI